MSDLDVSLRLRLVNDLSSEAKKAGDDLKRLDRDIGVLGKSKVGNVDREIADIGRKAKQSQTDVVALDRKIDQLGKASTNKTTGEIKQIGSASRSVTDDVKNLDRKLDGLGRVSTNHATSEIKQLGNSARTAGAEVAALDRKLDGVKAGQGFGRIDQPAGKLSGTMSSLKGAAGAAMGALMAFASVEQILSGLEQMEEGFRKVDKAATSVAITAEMRDPKVVEQIMKSNAGLGMRYGYNQDEVNSARQTFAASGVGLGSQDKILDPVLKAAKAADATPEEMSAAVVALKQNLGVEDKDIPQALDIMAKGGKEGSFEVKDMARYMAPLASLYASTGRKGLDGTSDLVAALEVSRMGSGNSEEAFNNLKNFADKIFSPDAEKNFKEMGVNLPALKKKSDKNGTPYMLDVIDESQRLTKGDKFKMNQLFGDLQAKGFLSAIMANRGRYDEIHNNLTSGSAGTVDEDYKFVASRPEQKARQREAAYEVSGNKLGKLWGAISNPVKELTARAVNPEYASQQREQEYVDYQMGRDVEELRFRISEKQTKLAKIPKPKFATDTDMSEITRQTLREDIAQLEIELKEAESVQSKAADKEVIKKTGQIPIPEARPDPASADKPLKVLGQDMSPAASKSMSGYNSTLNAEGDKAVSIAAEKAAQIQQQLNFTATPVIAPTFIAPSGGGASTGGKQASAGSGRVNVAQTFTGSNPRVAAARSVKEQNRSVRMARARSLGDTGSQPA